MPLTAKQASIATACLARERCTSAGPCLMRRPAHKHHGTSQAAQHALVVTMPQGKGRGQPEEQGLLISLALHGSCSCLKWAMQQGPHGGHHLSTDPKH